LFNDTSSPASSNGAIQAVEFLLESANLKCDVNIRDAEGNTPLHLTVVSSDDSTLAEGRLACVRLLLSHGADINATDESGYSPLHLAVLNGNVPIAQVLIEAQGVNLNAFTKERFTALHAACRTKSLEIAQLLVKAGADVHLRDGKGVSCLEMFGRFPKGALVPNPAQAVSPTHTAAEATPDATKSNSTEAPVSEVAQPETRIEETISALEETKEELARQLVDSDGEN
jgi:ankyrin repeat protein